MKKEHFEVLLENMSGKIDLVLEGHDTLNNKIDNVQASLDEHKQQNKEEHRLLLQMIKGVSQETKSLRKENETAHTALSKKLDTHKKENSDIKRRVSRLEAARA